MAELDLNFGSNNNDLLVNLIQTNLDERIIIFNNEVNDDLVEDVIFYILQWNREDRHLPKSKRQPIRLYINSPGGDTFICFNLIDTILASTTPVYTIGMGLIASAAYYMFLAGDKRIAFNHSVFLQHDGETAISSSSKKAKDTMAFFDDMEQRTKDYVLNRTVMEEDFYDANYGNEYWLYADKAKELGVVTHIVGEDIKLDDII